VVAAHRSAEYASACRRPASSLKRVLSALPGMCRPWECASGPPRRKPCTDCRRLSIFGRIPFLGDFLAPGFRGTPAESPLGAAIMRKRQSSVTIGDPVAGEFDGSNGFGGFGRPGRRPAGKLPRTARAQRPGSLRRESVSFSFLTLQTFVYGLDKLVRGPEAGGGSIKRNRNPGSAAQPSPVRASSPS